MKKILVLFAVVAILAIGIYAVKANKDGGIGGWGRETVEGEVTNVDLKGVALDGPGLVTVKDSSGEETVIAIPSMGIRLCAAYENIADAFSVEVGDKVSVRGTLNEEGQIVPCESPEDYLRIETVHQDAEVGLQFEYRKGPNGYVLEEHSQDGKADPSFVKLFNLMLKSDYESFKANIGASEGPPSIGIAVFENSLNQSASMWVDANPPLSNIELLSGEVDRDAMVGGANAVRYMIDGLYRTDTVAIAHGGYIYHISGAFLEEDSVIRNDFEPLLNSITFIPSAE